MTKLKLWALLCLLLPQCALSAIYDMESAQATLRGKILDDIEGIWQFPEDGATIFINKTSASTYDIFLLDSPRLDIEPGQKIGIAINTGQAGQYDAKLDNKPISNRKLKKSNAVFTISNGILKINPYSTGFKISLRRWIPYFMRLSISKTAAPEGLLGARKIYPVEPSAMKPIL